MDESIWDIEFFPNYTGEWFDPAGKRISALEAQLILTDTNNLRIQETTFDDPLAGVLTLYFPYDLKPAWREKMGGPTIYAVLEKWAERRAFRTPRVHTEWSHFAQSRLTAQTAHDQAVAHVRTQVLRNWRLRHRWRWPRGATIALAIIGALWLAQLVALVLWWAAEKLL